MPFDLDQAANRLGRVHGHAVAFRQALLDVAFASGCPMREQAVALEHGDAVTLRMASRDPAMAASVTRFAILDLDPPGHAATWAPELDSLGGPGLAQIWAVALHTLLGQTDERPWELTYTRGPALGVSAYVRDRLDAQASTIQLVPCPSVPSHGRAMDGVALTLEPTQNVSRRAESGWTVSLTVAGEDALARLRSWLHGVSGAWTLHQLDLRSHDALTALLCADRPLEPPPGIAIQAWPESPRLSFPVNEALMAWPETWLPRPLAVRTLDAGLWLAGLTSTVAEDAALPERAGALALTWQVESVAREVSAQVLVAVDAAESIGPVAAGLDGPIWRLPGAGERALAARGLAARLSARST